jgi:NADPH:quinone reductase-like Zn-dependent oxidoreductase
LPGVTSGETSLFLIRQLGHPGPRQDSKYIEQLYRVLKTCRGPGNVNMRVLLLGATGRVGTRLLPALLAHGHTAVVYTRNANRFAEGTPSRGADVVEGCATDVEGIKRAIHFNKCDAVVNSAGRASILGSSNDFARIFAAVTQAAAEIQQEQESAPLRCWLMSGWPILDSPKTGLPLLS